MSRGWHIRNIYLYLVCFVTLMMVVFGFITFLNNTARLVFPVEYSYRPTLMDVEREYLSSGRDVPPVAELEQIRDERVLREKERERAFKLRDLVGSLTFWLIPIPFYLYHWRKIRTELFPEKGGVQA